MFLLMMGILALGLTAGLYWLTGRWLSRRQVHIRKSRMRLLRIGIVLGVLFLCGRWRMVGLAAVHLVALFAVFELAAAGVRRAGKRSSNKRWYRVLRAVYRSGAVPVLLTGLLLGFGYYNMQHIVRTEYTVLSNKLQADYKIILLTDTHYGTIQDPDLLKNKIHEINALEPDLIVLGGDMVEEGTSRAAMQEAFEVLGGLKSTYGTYYVYGNHDRQTYAAATHSQTYTEAELVNAIESNGITVLEDRWVPVGPELLLAGRADASGRSKRASVQSLLESADRNRLVIVADHQPVEAAENAVQGVDLQLSGHTHAGQIFPVGLITEAFFGLNYGKYQQDGCSVVVSSGFTGWGFPVRTQGKCEYVLIRIGPPV